MKFVAPTLTLTSKPHMVAYEFYIKKCCLVVDLSLTQRKNFALYSNNKMNAPDMPVNVPVDNPNADTEWNDILRSHGIIPEKPKDPEPLIQEALIDAAQRAHDNRLEDKTLTELDDLEDLEDEDFLASYRQKRLAELGELQKASKFGSVLPLQKAEYGKEVTDASKESHVVVAMMGKGGEGSVESRVLSEVSACSLMHCKNATEVHR